MLSSNLDSSIAYHLIDLRNSESSATDIADEYMPLNIRKDAKPKNDTVTRPNGGYGTLTKTIA